MGKIFQNLLRIRGEVSRKEALPLGLLPLLLIFAIWFFLTWGKEPEDRRISPVTLPSPVEVFSKIPELILRGKLFLGAGASMGRVVSGFLVAAVMALPLGIFMGSFGKIRSMFQPLMVMGGYLPIAALVPLTLVWFGTGEFQKIMFLAMAFFVFLLPLVVKALDKVDEVYLQTGYTLGATRFQIVSRILVPVALFDIWEAMRLAMGIGWSYIILAEVIFSEAGLGQIIIVAQRKGPREYIYLVIAAIALLAWATDKIWDWAGKKLFSYKFRETR